MDDKELIAFLDRRFGETAQQIAGLRQEIAGLRQEMEIRFEHFGRSVLKTKIRVEGMRGDLRQVAVAVVAVSERLDSLRVECFKGFDEVKHDIAPFYTDLNRRLTFLEGWAERKDQDAIEVIRKKFGRPQAT